MVAAVALVKEEARSYSLARFGDALDAIAAIGICPGTRHVDVRGSAGRETMAGIDQA